MTAKLIQQSKHLFPATGCVGLTAFDAGPRQYDLIEERLIPADRTVTGVGKGLRSRERNFTTSQSQLTYACLLVDTIPGDAKETSNSQRSQSLQISLCRE